MANNLLTFGTMLFGPSRRFFCQSNRTAGSPRQTALFLALGGIFIGPLVAAAPDFSSPLLEVNATYDGSRVTCRVFDPAQGREYTNVTAAPAVFGFQNLGGVVTWTSGQAVWIRTYDPGVTNWVEFHQSIAGVHDLRLHRGMVAWSAPGQTGCTVYDRARRAWITDTASTTTYDLRCVDGLVSWTTPGAVFLRAYDPALGRWQKDDNAAGATFDLISTNGLAVWSSGNAVRLRQYDPWRGNWARADIPTPTLASLQNNSALAAWSTGPQLHACLFHPLQGQWLAATVSPPSFTALLLGITNATLTWSDGFQVSELGYNFAAGNWHAQPTRPLAGFTVSATSGRPPLTVYFTDLSVGGLSHQWNFSDGHTSSRRSPVHTFRAVGRFVITQTVTGTGGVTATFSTNILTDLDPPTGSVVINDGASFTTNRVVTLALTANDNSGVVARMRFSNDGVTWTAWEPYAPTRQWEFPPGVTTRTVRAQFEDPYGNVSAVVSDSIFLDPTPPPPVRLAVTETNVVEGHATLSVAVNLEYPMLREVRVDYFTRELTATTGQDFEAAAGTLTFASGATNRVLTVRIFDDALVEMNEQFQVVLTNGVDTVPGPPLTITLLDNDPPQVRFAAERFPAGEGDGQGLLTVLLSAASGRPVSVAYAASNGTATAGLDYVAVTGVLEFPPGETARSLAIPILDDALDEATETVEVRLHSPTNAVLVPPAAAILEIPDNDPPTVNFSSTEYVAVESAGSITLPVTLSKPSTETIYVDYATAGGTAIPGQDYVAASGTLIFPPGQTLRTFAVSLLDNRQSGPPKTVELRLGGFVNVLPGPRLRAWLTLLDDEAELAFAGVSPAPDGSWVLRLRGPAGLRVRLETSADLQSWEPLAELDNPEGTVEFRDARPPAAARYYRARVNP